MKLPTLKLPSINLVQLQHLLQIMAGVRLLHLQLLHERLAVVLASGEVALAVK